MRNEYILQLSVDVARDVAVSLNSEADDQIISYLHVDNLYSSFRAVPAVAARRVCVVVAHFMFGMTYASIGRLIGRDHSTLVHSSQNFFNFIEFPRSFDGRFYRRLKEWFPSPLALSTVPIPEDLTKANATLCQPPYYFFYPAPNAQKEWVECVLNKVHLNSLQTWPAQYPKS